MNIARASFGIGDEIEDVEGDPSAVLAEITMGKGPVNKIEFDFDGGNLTITKDNDVLGEVEGVENSSFVLKKILVHANKTREFCDLNEAVNWAREEPGFEDFEFEICAVTPQGGKTLKKRFKEIIIDIDDETCGKCQISEKDVKSSS